jgi:hypothetical protein
MNCTCQSEDAEQAEAFLRANREFKRVNDETHYIVTVIRCKPCRRWYLSVFYELIDWKDGDDSQARNTIEVSEEQADRIKEAGEGANESFIDSLGLNGRHLRMVFPRGGDRGIEWVTGALVHFPHD